MGMGCEGRGGGKYFPFGSLRRSVNPTEGSGTVVTRVVRTPS